MTPFEPIPPPLFDASRRVAPPSLPPLPVSLQPREAPPESRSSWRRRGDLVRIMRAHFVAPEHYGELAEPLSGLFWRPQGGDGTLAVESLFSYRHQAEDRIPGVFVGFDAVQFAKAGTSAVGGGTADGSGVESSLAASSALVVKCVAATPDQALLLAETSCSYLTVAGRTICRHLGLSDLQPSSLGQVTQVKGEGQREHYLVDLLLSFTYTWGHTVRLEGHRIKVVAHEAILR